MQHGNQPYEEILNELLSYTYSKRCNKSVSHIIFPIYKHLQDAV